MLMNNLFEKEVKASLLGKTVHDKLEFTSEILVPISRDKIQLTEQYEFAGRDIWNAYEFYYLSHHNKPEVYICRIDYSSSSPYIVESKSLKLYLNSFYNRTYESTEQVKQCIKEDLENIIKHEVGVSFLDIETLSDQIPDNYISLDKQVKNITDHKALIFKDEVVSETVYTHTFRSLCPVTSQPDFASIIIYYEGKQLEYESLLSYLVSFCDHQGFHEHCIDSIFQKLASQK